MKKTICLFAFFLLSVAVLSAQQRTVTGTVTDAAGTPLPGATVQLKNTQTGITTDVDGTYSLQMEEGADVLVFSFIGFATQEIEVRGRSVVDVLLADDINTLDEVIVVGYGKQIKSKLTGNIAKVSGDAIEGTPVVSLEQTLQGKAAGVFIESSNGKPGGAIRVRVRGASSISAGNEPLYVVDGMPMTVQSQNVSGAPLNPLADLNFNDIQSVEILKDASAAAIYGSRGSNGVVLITTKQGKQGQTRIELNMQAGMSKPTGRREFLNAEEYVELYTRSAIGGGKMEYALYPDYWGSEQEAIDWYVGFIEERFTQNSGWADWRKQEVDTDWQDLIFRNAATRQASVSATGGTEKLKYFASAAWNSQEGILVGNGFERMSARLNLDQAVSERFNIGINLSLSRTITDQVSDDNQFETPLQIVSQSPLTPPKNENGEYYDRPVTNYYNSLLELDNTKNDIQSFRTLGNAWLRYDILSGLKLNGEFGLDMYNTKDLLFSGRKTLAGEGSNGFGRAAYGQTLNYNSKLFVDYDLEITDVHNFSLTTGMDFQRSRTDFSSLTGQQFAVDDLKTLASAASITQGLSSIDEFSFLSYFGRLNYDFDRKYLLTLSGRVDGSSRFGANNRYGFFPAASAGWVLTEEDFLKSSKSLSFLKVRGSYGLTGNAAINNYAHLGLYDGEGYKNVPGLTPTQIPNPSLSWEKTLQKDIGIDFGLFNNRLTGELDYYEKKTTDLLLDVPVPATSGFLVQPQNIGSVRNRGFEVVLNSNNLTGKLKWNTSFNIAFNKNRVLELSAGQEEIDNGGVDAIKVGHPINVFVGAEYAGVNPANGDALFYLNKEGQEKETTNNYFEAEQVVIGSPMPDFFGGLTNSFTFNSFSLNVTLQGVYGNEINNLAGVYTSCQACWFDNQTKDQLKYWDKPGDVTDVPEPRFWFPNGEQPRNSRFISDGSYLRLKNLSLAYEFPSSVLDAFHFSRLKLYVTASNLLTLTKYEGWDPEVTTDLIKGNLTGVDFYSAPQPKTFVFGLTARF